MGLLKSASVQYGFVSTPSLRSVGVNVSNTPLKCVAKCSAEPVSRRKALSLAALATTTVLLPVSPARSENRYESKIRRKVALAKLGMEKAKVLKETVEKWKDSFSEDDEYFAYRYSSLWLEPVPGVMDFVGYQQNVDIGDAQAVQTYAAALKGHLLELNMEAKNRKKEGILRELDEFVETVQDFLTLPGITRFVK